MHVILFTEVPDFLTLDLHRVYVFGLEVVRKTMALLNVLQREVRHRSRMQAGHLVEASDVPTDEACPKGKLLEIAFGPLVRRDQLFEVVVGDPAVVTVNQLLRVLVIAAKGASQNLVRGANVSAVASPTDETLPVEGMRAENCDVEVKFTTVPGLLVLEWFSEDIFETNRAIGLL